MWDFIKSLFDGVFSSYNSITAYIGIFLFFMWLLLPKIKWGGKMKKKIEAISWPYRLLIILSLIFISVILTSYSIYSEQQQKINELTNKKLNNTTKQEIRTFLESINPEFLQEIDKGRTKILTTLSASKHVELVNLSKQSDFNKYLSFKHIDRDKDNFNDFKDPNIFLEGDEFYNWNQAYYLYPKDALTK